MNEKELRKHTDCDICGEKVGKSLMFGVIKSECYALDMSALQRQQGLTMMLGGSAQLARVMSADEDMAQKLAEQEFTVCLDCFTNKFGRLYPEEKK